MFKFKFKNIIAFLLLLNQFFYAQESQKQYRIHFEGTPCTLVFTMFSNGGYHGYMEIIYYKRTFLGLSRTKKYTTSHAFSTEEDKWLKELITDFDKNWYYYPIPNESKDHDYFTISGLSKQKFIKISCPYFFHHSNELDEKKPLDKLRIFHNEINKRFSASYYLFEALSMYEKGTFFYIINNKKFIVKNN